jgi:hypothetical protein
MIEDPTVTSLRALQMEVALGKAISLSCPQAREMWRAMQLIANKTSVEGMPGNLIQLATEFNRCPIAWKVIADKAFVNERKTGQRKVYRFGKDLDSRQYKVPPDEGSLARARRITAPDARFRVI